MFRGFALASLIALVLTLGALAPVYAADPAPGVSPAPTPVLVDPLDPRAGDGSNKIGSPLLAIAVVLVIGTIAIGATFAFVRVTRRA